MQIELNFSYIRTRNLYFGRTFSLANLLDSIFELAHSLVVQMRRLDTTLLPWQLLRIGQWGQTIGF